MTQAHPPGDQGSGSEASYNTSDSQDSGFGAGLEEGGRSAAKKKPARRRRKKKAVRSSERDRPAASADTPPPEAERGRDGSDGSESDATEKKPRRRRGSRGGRRRSKKPTEAGAAVEAIPGEQNDLPDLPDETQLLEGGTSADGSKKKRKRRRSRRKKAPSGSSEPSDEAGDDSGEEGADGGRRGTGSGRTAKKAAKRTTRKRASRKKVTGTADQDGAKKTTRRKTKPSLTPEEEAEQEAALRTLEILVNTVDKAEQRVAVVDGERIIDFLMTSETEKTLVNDIYRGRIVNLEPAIGAAFVDFGQGRNGFLHTSDVLGIYGEKDFKLQDLLTSKVDPEDWDEDSSQPAVSEDLDDDDDEAEAETPEKGNDRPRSKPRRQGHRRSRERRPISDLLKVGDQVAVQITKDAIGDKGPTLTTYISIPGRYLVLMPSMSRTGVSRKIPDDKERRRLKRLLASLKGITDMGVIVRTAGIGKTKADLQRDLDYLLGVWDNFGKRLRAGRGPSPLYQESDVARRTLRDLFNVRTKRVVVDDPEVYEQMVEFAEQLMPEHTERIELHKADRPLFHHFGIEQDFEKIFARRVELPSGGSIVFDQAEALVAIDVNSGRTRTNSFDFEDVALKTNMEAVPEIARQMRLRDLGGILVCDFIDMVRSSSNRQVERSLRDELSGDRARSKLGRISQFGLLELTRQRLGPGTHSKVFQACPRCRGTGKIRTVESRAQAILRRLGSALTQKGFSSVEVRAHPEVVDYLKEDLWDYVRALEHRFEKDLTLTSVPEQPEDSVLRYLRADGREVRPGGRRKR